MHCDVDQQDSVAHIWQCLDEIGVERIDHGVNAIEDERLLEEIKRRGLGLTVCPISNSFVTDGTKGDLIRQLMDQGVLVTINSDDPAYFPGYIAENLSVIQKELGLTNEEISTLVSNAFTISWLSESERGEYLSRVEAFAQEHA